MQLMFGIHRSIDRIYSQVYSQVSSSIRTRYTDKFICLYCLLIVLLPPKEWRYTVYLHIIQTKRNTSLIFFIGILNALDTPGSTRNLNFRCESSKWSRCRQKRQVENDCHRNGGRPIKPSCDPVTNLVKYHSIIAGNESRPKSDAFEKQSFPNEA